MDSAVERFWSKVDKGSDSECWLWRGAQSKGRGHFAFDDRTKIESVHRIAWKLTRGPIPEGLCVLHRCDVPLCVNPNHLFLGTQADNMRDMFQKGREAATLKPGVQNSRAKLTVDQALLVVASDESNSVLARRFGVNPETIRKIKVGKSQYLPRSYYEDAA